ncbi:MAG TPA: VOC family protein [Opitutaceae bacterium]|jgi:predicted 3-demethylubiquinone-9 3-methyltransferase (glyoxalase superfamily)
MKQITPCLWFEEEAEQAAKFYVSVFGGKSRILQVTRYGDGQPGRKGSVLTVVFTLNGQKYVGLNGGPHDAFNDAVSFYIECKTQKEIDQYWRKLSKGGKEIQCGWLRDRYGVRWQVVPANIHRLIDAKHPERAARVMQAVRGMVKLDVAQLERAYRG